MSKTNPFKRVNISYVCSGYRCRNMAVKADLIYLVDDDRSTNFFNKWLIEKLNLGCSLEVYKNGKEAIEAVQAASGAGPDAILLDVNMPVMDGFEFLERYRASGIDKGKVALMLTNPLLDDKKQLADELGVDDFINKPLTEEKLREFYNRHFQ